MTCVLKAAALYRYKSKKKAFCHYAKKYADGSKGIEADLDQLRKQATVIRVLAHTQIGKISFGQKKAHLAEIQVTLCLTFMEGISCYFLNKMRQQSLQVA